jgi:uncharacterized protein (DUF2141 family)
MMTRSNKTNQFLLAAMLGAAFIANAASAADLTIAVDGVASADGQIMVAIYSGGDTFPGKPLRAVTAPAAAGAVVVQVRDLPAGDYAYAVYHDANGNGKMDRNLAGIPTEDYAFSNNALGKRGPPSYADARFVLPAGGARTGVSLR